MLTHGFTVPPMKVYSHTYTSTCCLFTKYSVNTRLHSPTNEGVIWRKEVGSDQKNQDEGIFSRVYWKGPKISKWYHWLDNMVFSSNNIMGLQVPESLSKLFDWHTFAACQG